MRAVVVAGAAVLAGMTAAGCAGRHEASASSQAALGCPEDLCGRTKVLSRVVGEPNPDGISLTNVLAPRGLLELRIEGDQFAGVTSSGRRVTDEAMLNTLLLLERRDDHARFYLRIAALERVPDWVTGTPVAAYRLVYQRIDLDDGRGERPLCGTPEGSRWKGLAGLSFVFGDDKFVEATRTLTVVADQWFNLACAGDDRAAMHLYRHDQVGAKLGYQTSVNERQAFYKMLGADYCGSGRVFTKEGVPFRFVDSRGFFPSLDPPATAQTIEAVWNAKGAACVSNPRLAPLDPGVFADIQAACPLPTCEALLGENGQDWQRFGHTLSDVAVPSM